MSLSYNGSPSPPTTKWTLFRKAHDPTIPQLDQQEARSVILDVYLPFVEQWLCTILRRWARSDWFDELRQEFSINFLEGKFKNAKPDKGRLRDYLGTALRNLVNDALRKRGRSRTETLGDREVPLECEPFSDQEFDTNWRECLVQNALQALARDAKSRTLAEVLQLHLDHPEETAQQLATRLSLGESQRTAEWVGAQLFKARQKLSQLICKEVRNSLDDPSDERVEEELASLGLLVFLRTRRYAKKVQEQSESLGFDSAAKPDPHADS